MEQITILTKTTRNMSTHELNPQKLILDSNSAEDPAISRLLINRKSKSQTTKLQISNAILYEAFSKKGVGC